MCACVYVASILSWFISYLDQYLSIIPLQLHTSVEALAIHKQTHTVSLTSGGNNAIIFFHLLKSHSNLSSVCKGQGGKTQSSLKLHLNQCVSGIEKRRILALWVLSYGRGFKGIVHPKIKFWHNLPTLMSFQHCMTYFLLQNMKKDILKKVFFFSCFLMFQLVLNLLNFFKVSGRNQFILATFK